VPSSFRKTALFDGLDRVFHIQFPHRTKVRSIVSAPSLCLVDWVCSSAESELLSSKQNVVGLSPARPPNSLRSSSSWKERSSHKREGAGSNPASATKSETRRRGDREKGRQGEGATGRRGDTETRRERSGLSPRRPVSPSPRLRVSVPVFLTGL
jgi:hypothetical protein